MTDLTKLEREVATTKRTLVGLTDARTNKQNNLLRAAREQINADLEVEFGTLISDARRAATEAENALDAARVAAASDRDVYNQYKDVMLIEWGTHRHVWHGENPPFYPTGRRGVLEICERASEFPENDGPWRLPKIGDVFIRLLKRDDTPGKKYVKMVNRVPANWLPDGTKPANAAKD